MKNESSYVTLELFQRCIPPFQEGLKAKEALEADDGSMPREERVRLRKMVHAGEDAWAEVMRSISWVIENAVKTEINKPRTFYFTPDPEELRQAGYEGAYKMMKNADLNKMASAVNYLMQWVNTYVSRAAFKEESQFGLSANKLQTFRKISAIRAKLASKLDREPTDEEVFEYVNAGKAHVKTFMGKSGKGSDTKSARKADKIPLKMIQEQGEFQSNGAAMRYSVTDETKINSMVHVQSTENQIINSSSTRLFWESWFKHVGIISSQWDTIAANLELYDVGDAKTRPSKRLVSEVQMLIGSETGGMAGFATAWHEEHGPGAWDVFMKMPPQPAIDLDANDEDGRKLFRVLRFVKSEKDNKGKNGESPAATTSGSESSAGATKTSRSRRKSEGE